MNILLKTTLTLSICLTIFASCKNSTETQLTNKESGKIPKAKEIVAGEYDDIANRPKDYIYNPTSLKSTGYVSYITNIQEYGQALILSEDQQAVMVFTASWCGPCRAFSPEVADLASKYHKKASFYKIDVDQFPRLANILQVVALPTTVIYKRGDIIVSRLVGRSKTKLEKMIKDNMK
ncbi:MAG: thioredoxin family protein [Marinifilaceae bacterium]|jgi:thiol-disulfide isomerase/thioredoxin|nr:thioredoxin family protein [Marinifilaceae bacterium]